MTRDEIVETARAAIAPLGEGKMTVLGVKVKNEFTKLSEDARAEALKVALQIVVEHEKLSDAELQDLGSTLQELTTKAQHYKERAERYKQFKRQEFKPEPGMRLYQ